MGLFLIGYLYNPTELNLIRYYLGPLQTVSRPPAPCPQCSEHAVHGVLAVLPVSLPTLLMMVTAVIQVACLSYCLELETEELV